MLWSKYKNDPLKNWTIKAPEDTTRVGLLDTVVGSEPSPRKQPDEEVKAKQAPRFHPGLQIKKPKRRVVDGSKRHDMNSPLFNETKKSPEEDQNTERGNQELG
jgi:hypothetical protein